ncbi:hypothetical protein PAMP_014175 [Pampus punctatissimus]
MENTSALPTFHPSQSPSSFLQPVWNSSTTSPSAPHHSSVFPNVAYTAAELVIAFLSTTGNLLVCMAVGLNRKLRTISNYFLVSLAVADICVGIIAIPCAILTDIGLPHHNLYLCLFMLSGILTFTQSSIFSLLAVAVERYLAIFMPLRYSILVTPRNAVLVIIAIWVMAFFIGLVPLMGWHKKSPDASYCFFVVVMDLTFMVYFHFFTCLLTPVSIMFLIYGKIFLTVKKQVRRIASEQSGRGEEQARATASLRQEMKMATSLFLIVFLFAICWIPLDIINCFLLLCPQCPMPLELVLTVIILSHANSAVNPFLYAYTMTAFRNTFKDIFLCCRTMRDRKVSNMAVGGGRGGQAARNTHQT